MGQGTGRGPVPRTTNKTNPKPASVSAPGAKKNRTALAVANLFASLADVTGGAPTGRPVSPLPEAGSDTAPTKSAGCSGTLGTNAVEEAMHSPKRNAAQLIQHISHVDYEILSLQSLHCRPGDLPRVEGYYYPPVCGPVVPDGRVMVCIYIKLNVQASEVAETSGPPNGYSCAVRVRVKGRADFTVVNCYTPAKCTTFQWLSEVGGGSRCLVTGDFNVRDSSWEKGFEYSSPTLTGQINESNFIVLNDGSFTRIPDRSDQGQTAIDLTFASADIADGVGWEVGEDSLSSDHLPIVISMCGTAEVGCPAPVSKYNYDKVNWDLFRSLLGSKDIDIGQADIEEVNSQITSSILAAARVAIPTSSSGTPRPNSNPWWNKDCEEAVKEKRMRYRFYCRIQNAETHEDMKAANRNCNRTLAQAKKDHWMSFAESVLTDKQDLGAVWRKIKKMKGQVVAPEYDLRQGDSVYSTDQAKADAFAEAFAEASDCDSSLRTCADAVVIWRPTTVTRSPTTVWRLTPLWLSPNSNEPCRLSRRSRCPPAWTQCRTICWGRCPSLFWRLCWASSRGAGREARSPRGGNTP